MKFLAPHLCKLVLTVVLSFISSQFLFSQQSARVGQKKVHNSASNGNTSYGVQPIKNQEQQVEDLIRDFFLKGSCIEIKDINTSSAIIDGKQVQIGKFEQDLNLNMGFSEGIILSTGSVSDAIGPNNAIGTSTDFGGDGATDEAFIEFKFKPTGDAIKFNYVFASEEYPEYVCGGFNDSFSFFIKKDGTTDPLENIALIPGTLAEVTIDNVNDRYVPGGTCPPVDYSMFYNSNPAGATGLEFDGYTTVLSAEKTGLDACEWYYMMIYITDKGDGSFDSAVFLEANSFQDNNPITVSTSGTSVGTQDAEESCKNGYFLFERSADLPMDEDFTIELAYSGTATPGVDFDELPSSITIPAGENSIQLPVIPYFDTEIEGNETLVVETTNITCGCTTDPLSAEINIIDYAADAVTIEDVFCEGGEYDLPNGTTVNTAGDYTVLIPRLSNPDCDSLLVFSLTNVDAPEVTDLSQAPFDCDSVGGVVDLTSFQNDFILEDLTNLGVSYYTDSALTDEIASPTNFDISTSTTVYAKVIYTSDDTCESVAEINLELPSSPSKVNTNIVVCEPTSTTFNFDLTSLINEIQNGNSDVNVTFHELETQANSGTEIITNTENYTSETKTIYSRAEIAHSGGVCYTVAEVDLVVVPQPMAINEMVVLCSDETSKRVDLSELDLSIASDTEFKLYQNRSDAESETNEIELPATLETGTFITKSISTLENSCVNYGELDLTISQRPQYTLSAISSCKNDGVASFDLEQVKAQIESTLTNVSVAFYETESSTNSLDLLHTIEASTTIYARLTNHFDCVSNIPLNLVVTEEVIEPLEKIIYCNGSPYRLKDGTIVTEAGTYQGSYFDLDTDCDRQYNTQLLPASLHFPNAFAPNVNGRNEIFKPKFLENCDVAISDYHLTIYNRWGEKIFESNNFDSGWDGSGLNGEVLEGVYIWYATYKNGDESNNNSGTITVLR